MTPQNIKSTNADRATLFRGPVPCRGLQANFDSIVIMSVEATDNVIGHEDQSL